MSHTSVGLRKENIGKVMTVQTFNRKEMASDEIVPEPWSTTVGTLEGFIIEGTRTYIKLQGMGVIQIADKSQVVELT